MDNQMGTWIMRAVGTGGAPKSCSFLIQPKQAISVDNEHVAQVKRPRCIGGVSGDKYEQHEQQVCEACRACLSASTLLTSGRNVVCAYI